MSGKIIPHVLGSIPAERLSLSAFRREFVATRKAFLIENGFELPEQWRCLSLRLMREKFAHIPVRVHFRHRSFSAAEYFNDPKHYALVNGPPIKYFKMTFEQFANTLLREHYERGEGQFSLLAVNPFLFLRSEEDLTIPPYCHSTGSEQPHFWLAGSGSFWNLHRDNADVFIASVFGTKRVALIPAGESQFLYPHPRNASISLIPDLLTTSTTSFPLILQANIYTCLVRPGDLLYLPRGTWHETYNEQPCASISFWPPQSLD